MKRSATFLLLLMCVAAAPSWSATKFVNKLATGSNNGTSWANAWTELSTIAWSSLSPGDVVCVAGGNYSGRISTAKSGSSGSPITIQRATATSPACGTGTAGWSASFDSQVVLSGGANITINNNYITIDGMVWDGIRVVMQNPGSRFVGVGSTHSAATTNITIRNVETYGPCLVSESTCVQNSDHVGLEIYGTGGPQSNWLVQYMDNHGSCMNALLLNAPNLVWEHSRLGESLGQQWSQLPS